MKTYRIVVMPIKPRCVERIEAVPDAIFIEATNAARAMYKAQGRFPNLDREGLAVQLWDADDIQTKIVRNGNVYNSRENYRAGKIACRTNALYNDGKCREGGKACRETQCSSERIRREDAE